jgi:hypothetical protein
MKKPLAGRSMIKAYQRQVGQAKEQKARRDAGKGQGAVPSPKQRRFGEKVPE